MKTQRLDQKINETEKAELLEDFKVEELEQRFEMGWFRNEVTAEIRPAVIDDRVPDGIGADGAADMKEIPAYGGKVTIKF
ncbi:hypothetical protein [Elizabethkingia anophelis]|uniref:hypothetical protein n=1 Tax=Elizabethkingia anophelis TaxID=1117645 RepID=UPI00373205B8